MIIGRMEQKKEEVMERVHGRVLEKLKQRMEELLAEAKEGGFLPEGSCELTEEQAKSKHFDGMRIDVNTKGTYREEDFALLANLKRYRAALANIDSRESRGLYDRLLDVTYAFYDWYAELWKMERKARFILENGAAAYSNAGPFRTRLSQLLADVSEEKDRYRRYVKSIEHFMRLLTTKKNPGDEEEFAYRLRSEEDFPEDMRLAMQENGIEWEEIAVMGEELHNMPPVLARVVMVIDGFSDSLAEPILDHSGTDTEFKITDPFVTAFGVSNFDNAMQPLFTTAQVRKLREQKKSIYDMIFVDGTSIKELYGPYISRDQDPKERGNEMKLRFLADVLNGKTAAVSNGERFMPLLVRVELPGVKAYLEEMQLANAWSLDKVEELIEHEGENLIRWMEQLQEKMWGVIETAVEENPDGIEDEEEIQKWLEGLLEIDEIREAEEMDIRNTGMAEE
ncbi:MAG: hypothetical protein PUC28_04295 [Blautia sp.]|nr:hypothetical protein [Blautia sp.]